MINRQVSLSDRLFGFEGEYPLLVYDSRGARVDASAALEQFFRIATGRLVHLHGNSGRDLFLANGARLYPDCQKVEIATPEVTTPNEICRFIKGNEQILVQVADEMKQHANIGDVALTRCNVSYGPSATTWAAHFSVGHRVEPSSLAQQLIPFLVSRVIYSGSGGFNNRTAGIEFMVSPRAAHIEAAMSPHSTNNRGIFHTKNEPLCKGFHRLHVLTGESLCSETSMWLTYGSLLLVVALIETGATPGDAVQLTHPVGAIHKFSTDVTCKERVRAAHGRQWTALEIQEHYLHQVELWLEHPAMPTWATDVCVLWRNILNRLKQGPETLEKVLDWPIRLAVYKRFVESRGVSWDTIDSWNRVLGTVDRTIIPHRPEEVRHCLSAEDLWNHATKIDEVLHRQGDLDSRKYDRDQLEQILEVRQQLFELDNRFGELKERGIFNSLDRAGVLDHHTEGVDEIDAAMSNPPAVGRAALRGKMVRELSSERRRYACDWSSIQDRIDGRCLDLSDPFATQEEWQTPQSDQRDQRRQVRRAHERVRETHPQSVVEPTRRPFERAIHCYRRGHYESAYELLCRSQCAGRSDSIVANRVYARVQCRRGFLDGLPILARMVEQLDRVPFWLITDLTYVHRFSGLTPHPEMIKWVRAGIEQLEEQQETLESDTRTFREQTGFWLLSKNRLDEARGQFEAICGTAGMPETMRLVTGRALAGLADADRRLGDPTEARRCADLSHVVLDSLSGEGDLADFALTATAKLEGDPAAALERLGTALTIQTRLGNRMGETRTRLLQARLDRDRASCAAAKGRLQELNHETPALRRCPLFKKVLSRWQEWTSGDLRPDDSGDVFWGL